MINEKFWDMEAWDVLDDHLYRCVTCQVPDGMPDDMLEELRRIVVSANRQARKVIGSFLEGESKKLEREEKEE